MNIHNNLKQLTCFAIVLSVHFISQILSFGLPLSNIVLGCLVPVFGWKKTMLIANIFTSLLLVRDFHNVFFFFTFGIPVAYLTIFSIYFIRMLIVLIVFVTVGKRIIY